MLGKNLVRLVLLSISVSCFWLFVLWQQGDKITTEVGYYGCEPEHFKTIVFNSTIPKRYRGPSAESKCTAKKANEVDLLGVVLAHHKAGTVINKDFYHLICSRMGINFIYMDSVPAKQIQQSSYEHWLDGQSQEIACQDYHKCNDRTIIQTKVDLTQGCLDLGVQCEDWFDIQCFVNQCSKLLKVDPQLKILNPIRNPFDLVISAYFYHTGPSHEKWSHEIPMHQMGLHFDDEINNMTVSEALKFQNEQIGLEICFQIISDVLKGMLLMKNLESQHNFSNIRSFKFEEIVGDFQVTASKQLEFLGIFEVGDLESDKQQVIQHGQFVMSDKNQQYQKQMGHITANKKIFKKQLWSILYEHDRAQQLDQITQLLGYSGSNNYQL